jgi:nucleoside-diphosphate-sugar epimerase
VEADPFEPLEWYGASKAESEQIAFGYSKRFEVTAVRPPRIVGPKDRESLPFFKLVHRGFQISIGGGPRPLSMIDVEDAAELLLRAASQANAVGEAFFAAGFRTTLEGLQDVAARALNVRPRMLKIPPALLRGLASGADLVSRATGHHLPLNRKLAKQLLAPAWTCSGEKARERLGFVPRYGLEESVSRTARWYRDHGWL